MPQVGPVAVRLVTVLDHPNQHFAPAFVALAARPDVEHRAIYAAKGSAGSTFDPGFAREVGWDVDLVAGYDNVVLDGAASSVWAVLSDSAPEAVVVPGWAWRINQIAIIWCLTHGVPFFLIGDSTVQHSLSSSRLKLLVRAAFLRVLFALSAGALTTGTFNRQFYERFGMRSSKLIPACYPFDAERFMVTRYVRAAIPRIVFAGKVTVSKGVADLIDALGLVRALSWTATVIGDGDQLDAIRAQANVRGILDRVEFTGFVNQSEMPRRLAEASIVVVPSHKDFRVLIVSEAMAAGAAVIVSDGTAVWGPDDLVEDGVSGMVFRSKQPASLAAKLRELLTAPDLLDKVALEGQRRALGQSGGQFAECVATALRRFLARK